MANIIAISDLRNYNEILKKCRVGDPVFLTKNGKGRYVILDIEEYNRGRDERRLLMKLCEVHSGIKDGDQWVSLEEIKKTLDL